MRIKGLEANMIFVLFVTKRRQSKKIFIIILHFGT